MLTSVAKRLSSGRFTQTAQKSCCCRYPTTTSTGKPAYELAEPKFIPAGTKLIQANWWDNSAKNPANPDPTIEVSWGEQSFEEMLFGAISLRFLGEEEAAEMRAKASKSATTTVASAQ